MMPKTNYDAYLKSSIICCPFSGDMYISCLSSFSYSLFYLMNVLPNFVTILFPIKSPVASAVFLTTHLEAAFAASIPVFIAVSINFLPYLSSNFIANDKKPYPLTYFLYFGSVEYLIFLSYLPNN